MVRLVAEFLSAAEVTLLGELARSVVYERGRQGTGYDKCSVVDRPEVAPIVQRALVELGVAATHPHDAWLIRYGEGSHIPPHVDPVEEGAEHHRLNALVAAAAGGEVFVDGALVALTVGAANVFRPDAMRHEVSRVERGTRIVFSVGTLR